MNLPSRLSSDLARRLNAKYQAARLSLPAPLHGVVILVSVLGLLAGTGSAGLAQETPQEGTSGGGASRAASNTPDLGEPIPTSQILAVDRDRLFSGSLYGRRILAELEKERSRLALEARKVEAALAAEEKSLTEQRSKLTPEAFRILADEFDDKVQSLRDERPVLEQEFKRRFETERNSFFEKVGPILGQVVRELGGIMIIDRRAILLTTQKIDITDESIQRIDLVLGDGRADTQSDDPDGGAVDDGADPSVSQPQDDAPAQN